MGRDRKGAGTIDKGIEGLSQAGWSRPLQCEVSLWLAETARKRGAIGKSVRIGLTHGADYLYVFMNVATNIVAQRDSSRHG